MPLFKYKSIDAAGASVVKVQNAAGKEQIVEYIRSRGGIPVYIEEYRSPKETSRGLLAAKVKPRDIAVFSRQFYTMLHSGITIINCIGILRTQTENKTLKTALSAIYDDLQAGVSLSEAMQRTDKIFPDLYINMVEAGEASGNLDAIMQRMAVHYDKETRLNAKVFNAMVYPAVLTIAVIGVVIAMLVLVMPMFVDMFADSGNELPTPTKMLITLSDSLILYWYVYIIAIVIFAFFARIFASTPGGARFIDGMKLKLPVFGITTKKLITSRFTRTLATLLTSGISLMRALEITAKIVSNTVMQDKLNDVRGKVQRGVALSTAIKECEIFAPIVYSMMMVGEESGQLDDILEKTADFYDAEVEEALQVMVSMIEPIMIVVMASIIGFMLISIYMPMFDLMQTVQ